MCLVTFPLDVALAVNCFADGGFPHDNLLHPTQDFVCLKNCLVRLLGDQACRTFPLDMMSGIQQVLST